MTAARCKSMSRFSSVLAALSVANLAVCGLAILITLFFPGAHRPLCAPLFRITLALCLPLTAAALTWSVVRLVRFGHWELRAPVVAASCAVSIFLVLYWPLPLQIVDYWCHWRTYETRHEIGLIARFWYECWRERVSSHEFPPDTGTVDYAEDAAVAVGILGGNTNLKGCLRFNPQRHRYLSPDPNLATDAWGNAYNVVLDANNDFKVTIGRATVEGLIAVWSNGRDGVNEFGAGDDIASWKEGGMP